MTYCSVRPWRQLVSALGTFDGATSPTAGEWQRLVSLADDHLLAPSLWSAGVRRGWWRPLPADALDAITQRLGGAVPPELVLQRAHHDNGDRNRDLLAQVDQVTTVLGGAGILAVPLKGAHALRAGWWPDPNQRVLRDLDLLVPRGDADRAAALLAEIGYRPLDSAPDPAADHQLPAVRLPGRAGSVELHVALARGRWRTVLAAEPILEAGVLDATMAVAHLIVQAQLHDEAHLLHRLPLRALFELAVISSGDEGSSIDWDVIVRTFDGAGARRALASHLLLARRWFGARVPADLNACGRVPAGLATLAADHPHAARRWEPIAYLPRSLAASRLESLYGHRTVWRLRARHLGGTVARRVQRPR